MAGWLGVGSAASGTVVDEGSGTAKRFTYCCDVERYCNEQLSMNNEQLAMSNEQLAGSGERRGLLECEELDRVAFLKESLLMGFRCVDGPDPVLFKKRFGVSVEECIPLTLKRWEGRDKMLFLNGFLAEAFDEMECTR